MRMIALIVVGGAALTGLVLLVAGLRGRRVDDHPHCRGCGFDLFGKPDAKQCPECGRALGSPRAVVMGKRRRRAGLAWSGAAMLALVLLGGGGMGWMAASDLDMQSLKPTWWLTSDLSSSNERHAALAELTRRLNADTLSRSQVGAIVARGLTLQADLKQTWPLEFGDFIETARLKGLVDDKAFARYLEQGLIFTLTVRPQVRLGDPVAYRQERETRLGSGSGNRPRLWLNFSDRHFAVGEHTQPLGGSHGTSLGGRGRGTTSGSFRHEALTDGSIKVGSYPCELAGTATVTFGHQGPFVHEWEMTLSATAQVVPRDTQTVELIDDAALRQQVEQSVTVEGLRVRRDRDDWRIHVRLDINPRPVGLAHEVVVVAGERRIELGSIYKAPEGETLWGVSGSSDLPLNAETVRVILEPDINAAHRSVDVFDLWNRPIEFENVVVEVEPPRE